VSAPAWAERLVALVCAEADVAPPTLTWRRRRAEHSTGVARRSAGVIAVRAGSDLLDQRLTVLHELAHWIGPAPSRRRRGTTHHGVTFYRIAFHLYGRHGLTDADALRLEAARYPSALRHAASLGVPGAAELLAERRETLRARPRRRWRVLVPEHTVVLQRDGRWQVCATCGQRVVASALARARRARRPVRHVLMGVGAS
jgi:hypothetical protein